MNYKIKDLEEMIMISSDGQSREEALMKLEGYLDNSNISSQGFYYIEAYSSGGVAGAMALAKVDREPKRNSEFMASKLEPGKYLIFDYPYEKYVEDNMPGADEELDVKGYLNEKGYMIGGFPFFEFLEETDNKIIRIYVPIVKI